MQSALTLAGYAALLVRFSGWAVAALCLATVPATIAEMRFSKLAFKVRNWRSPESRRLLYLEYVLANDEHAKEVKLFDLGKLLLGRYRALSEDLYEQDRAIDVRRAAWTQALSLLATGTFYAAYAVMAIGAAMGRLTLGNMTLYVLAFRQGQQAFQSALGAIGGLYEHNLYMSNLWDFMQLAEEGAAAAGAAALAKAGPTPGAGLVLEDVGFRYTRARRPGRSGTSTSRSRRARASRSSARTAPGRRAAREAS